MRGRAALLVLLWPLAGAAQDPAAMPALDLPANARLALEESLPGPLRLATGPWDGTIPRAEVAGPVDRQVWQIAATGLTTAQIADRIARAAEAAGFAPLFACGATACGGFDFRFALDTAAPPALHVDLGDYRYLAARRVDGAAIEAVVSRTARTGFVQLSLAGGAEAADAAPPIGGAPGPVPGGAPAGGLGAALVAEGHVVLTGLDFATGQAALAEGPVPALADLADWLAAHPDARIALVGHTDADGPLELNIALSHRRAEAVRDRLVGVHGAEAARIETGGMGWLAPRASNLDPGGREANRRVEAILLAP
ncbi:OmpA family protein [Wenxinia saemankumensis]|uniref:OmpA-OmpF porin, OOP family n=1 Tax=Wenxinia saemankumensis TaxID=1447782 RepID=A0A1M6EUE7_9RHOB|nr:OmpA family protein [Wenxinia saemankumensis]SHI89111.1 OmpA-OmpF porin, OOP family [Wenxinia saemankumensis]